MNRLLGWLALVLGWVSLGHGPLLGAPATPAPFTLRVMTYNLRFASDQPPHAWPERRPVMQRLLTRERPDVIGTQEGVFAQLCDVAADLPDYAWIGLGRDGGSRGEFMAVFYRRDRLEPLAFDHFWLSDTPDFPSATWGNHFKRLVTWVRFRERVTGREFEVWNTHFDHQSEPARQKSAALLRARLAAVEPTRPVLLLGDFNCVAGASAAYAELTQGAGLTDLWLAARVRHNDGLNTFNDFAPAVRAGERIDWILGRGIAGVPAASILDDAENGRTPSDHFPVVATVEF
jgi:endonuclease/exonuclease/phosphatase family metal-dependent hydrolase